MEEGCYLPLVEYTVDLWVSGRHKISPVSDLIAEFHILFMFTV